MVTSSESESRMLSLAGPVLLTAAGAVILLLFAVLAYLNAVSVGLIWLGLFVAIAALVAGIAWGLAKNNAGRAPGRRA